MAGKEQTQSGQPAHASPNLMSRACQAPLIGPVKLRPESQEESDSFPPEGKTGLGEPMPIANNKHEAKKKAECEARPSFRALRVCQTAVRLNEVQMKWCPQAWVIPVRLPLVLR